MHLIDLIWESWERDMRIYARRPWRKHEGKERDGGISETVKNVAL